MASKPALTKKLALSIVKTQVAEIKGIRASEVHIEHTLTGRAPKGLNFTPAGLAKLTRRLNVAFAEYRLSITLPEVRDAENVGALRDLIVGKTAAPIQKLARNLPA